MDAERRQLAARLHVSSEVVRRVPRPQAAPRPSGPERSGLASFEIAGAGRPTGARGWTNEQILAAIRAWCSLYDEVPCQADWDPHRARRIGQEWRIRRYRTGDWPSLKTVINRYGRLSDAIAQAGLAPRQTKSGRTDREA